MISILFCCPAQRWEDFFFRDRILLITLQVQLEARTVETVETRERQQGDMPDAYKRTKRASTLFSITPKAKRTSFLAQQASSKAVKRSSLLRIDDTLNIYIAAKTQAQKSTKRLSKEIAPLNLPRRKYGSQRKVLRTKLFLRNAFFSSGRRTFDRERVRLALCGTLSAHFCSRQSLLKQLLHCQLRRRKSYRPRTTPVCRMQRPQAIDLWET